MATNQIISDISFSEVDSNGTKSTNFSQIGVHKRSHMKGITGFTDNFKKPPEGHMPLWILRSIDTCIPR